MTVSRNAPPYAIAAGWRACRLGLHAGAATSTGHSPRQPPIPFTPRLKERLVRHRRHFLAVICAALFISLAAGPSSSLAAGPASSETVYLQGHTAEINTGAAVILDASVGLLQHASPIYIIGFPVAAGTTGPITLPSGYEPQHNGFPPAPIPYHDHVLAAAPRLGTSGTAGQYSATLRVVEMR